MCFPRPSREMTASPCCASRRRIRRFALRGARQAPLRQRAARGQGRAQGRSRRPPVVRGRCGGGQPRRHRVPARPAHRFYWRLHAQPGRGRQHVRGRHDDGGQRRLRGVDAVVRHGVALVGRRASVQGLVGGGAAAGRPGRARLPRPGDLDPRSRHTIQAALRRRRARGRAGPSRPPGSPRRLRGRAPSRHRHTSG